MFLKATISKRQVEELRKVIAGTNRKLSREINTAINKTSKKTISIASKKVGEELATAQREIKKTLDVKEKSTPRTLQAKVRLSKTERIPLKNFRARQSRKGVTFKISKTKGRGMIPGAFVVNSLGEHVFARFGPKKRVKRGRNKGLMKQGLTKKFGPSPWGVYVKQKADRPVRRSVRKELRKQINERLRFLKLKKAGTI